MTDSNKPRLRMDVGEHKDIWRMTFPKGYAPSGCRHVEFVNWFDEGWNAVADVLRKHKEASNAQ
jgi:hypothetical protein